MKTYVKLEDGALRLMERASNIKSTATQLKTSSIPANGK